MDVYRRGSMTLIRMIWWMFRLSTRVFCFCFNDWWIDCGQRQMYAVWRQDDTLFLLPPPSLLCYVTRIYNIQQATPFLRMNNEMNGVLSTTTMRFQWRRRRSDSIDFQQRRELRTPLTNASMSNASFLMTAPHYTSPERWMLLLLLVKSSPAWMFDPWYYYYDDCEYVQPFCLYSMIRSIYYVTVLTRQEDDDPTYTHSTLPRESLLQPILLHASQK